MKLLCTKKFKMAIYKKTKQHMINGSFVVPYFSEIYNFWGIEILCLKNKKTGKWELPGGGMDINEGDHFYSALRELWEETAIKAQKEDLVFFAVLEQRLSIENQKNYSFEVEIGHVFIHTLKLKYKPKVILSEEHSEYTWFSLSSIKKNPDLFMSGALKMIYSFIKSKKGKKIIAGEKLRDQKL